MAPVLFLLVLALTLFSTSADVSWNVDCGSSGKYTDMSNIDWVGDSKTLVKTGKRRSVSSNYSMSDHVDLNTLRIFNHKRLENCYKLRAENSTKVLLHVNFYYGNYDNKSSPPSFGLKVDGNYRFDIKTSMEPGKYDSYEFIYITKGNSIKLCFRQKHRKHLPFVSSIRVRSLPFSMYSSLDPKHALLLQGRYAFGSDKIISYPDDAYDRIWNPIKIIGSEYMKVARSNASSSYIDTSTTAIDNPPQAILENVMTTSNVSARSMKILSQLVDNITSPNSPLYINMYFTEVLIDEPSSTPKRSFYFVFDNQSSTSKVIIPTYGRATELTVISERNMNISLENTILELVSTSNSSLPPLISAMEVFHVFTYKQKPPRTKMGWIIFEITFFVVGVVGTISGCRKLEILHKVVSIILGTIACCTTCV